MVQIIEKSDHHCWRHKVVRLLTPKSYFQRVDPGPGWRQQGRAAGHGPADGQAATTTITSTTGQPSHIDNICDAKTHVSADHRSSLACVSAIFPLGVLPGIFQGGFSCLCSIGAPYQAPALKWQEHDITQKTTLF